MKVFEYRAVDGQGTIVENRIEADSRESAGSSLEAKGLTPLRVAEARDSPAGPLGGQSTPAAALRMHRGELAVLSRQFATLLRAGLSITRALDSLSQQGSPQRRRVLDGVRTGIGAGSSLSDALARFPAAFAPSYVATIGAAERVGALPVALRQLADVLVWEERIRRNLRTALQYPLTVMCVALLAVIVLQQVVVPQFAQVFSTFGGELPLPTRILIGSSTLIADWWWAMLAAVAGGLVALRSYGRTESGALVLSRAVLRIPLIGDLVAKASLARFARLLGLLQSNGLPILTSLEVLGSTIANREIAHHVMLVHGRVNRGDSLSHAVAQSQVFTDLVKNMIRVGEESGTIDEAMQSVCELYDDEIQATIQTITHWIEPVLTVVLGAFVLFLALAIFLPWWDLTQIYRM